MLKPDSGILKRAPACMSAGMLIAASVKLLRLPLEVAYFQMCALPDWTLCVVGWSELALAGMFFWKPLRPLAVWSTWVLLGGAISSIFASGWHFLWPLPVLAGAGAWVTGISKFEGRKNF